MIDGGMPYIMPMRSIIHTIKYERMAIHAMQFVNVKNQNFLNISRRQSGIVSQKAIESGKPTNQKKRENMPLTELVAPDLERIERLVVVVVVSSSSSSAPSFPEPSSVAFASASPSAGWTAAVAFAAPAPMRRMRSADEADKLEQAQHAQYDADRVVRVLDRVVHAGGRARGHNQDELDDDEEDERAVEAVEGDAPVAEEAVGVELDGHLEDEEDVEAEVDPIESGVLEHELRGADVDAADARQLGGLRVMVHNLHDNDDGVRGDDAVEGEREDLKGRRE